MTKRGSLFTRLLAIYFIAGVLVIISMVSSYHFLSNKPHRKHIRNNLKVYAELLVEQERFPRRMELLLNKTGLKFHKIEIENEKKYETEKFPKHSFAEGKNFSISRRKHPLIIKLRKRDFTYYIHPDRKHEDRFGGWIPFIVGISFSLLILVLTYHVVQKLLKPIKQIEKGAKKFGEGLLDYSIPVEGNTELSRLSESINQMRNNISKILESKQELLLAIAHELKTPLSRMRLNIEMLEENKRQKDLIEEIDEMNSIIDSLLESERLERNSSLNLIDTDLKKFIESFQQARIEVEVPENEINFKIDPLRIKLALNNILNNALKYSDETVHLKLEGDSSHVEITVKDHGAGIPEEELAKITDAFYRPQSDRNRKTGGVGLGLYLVKQIISAHGGSMEITNDQGLRVKFTLFAK